MPDFAHLFSVTAVKKTLKLVQIVLKSSIDCQVLSTTAKL